MHNHNFVILPVLLSVLSACQALPEQFSAQNLRLTVYQNATGEAILPVARNAGGKRRAAWEKWLVQHRSEWQIHPNQSATGKTRWCAQWQQDGIQRICNRDNKVLVWFGYGQTRDKQIIEQANKIWIGH